MLRDDVKPLSASPQLAKDTSAVDNLLKISFLRNYALPLIMRDPSLYDLDAFYDHPLLSFLTAMSPNHDGYEAAFEQYDIETRQVYSSVSVFNIKRFDNSRCRLTRNLPMFFLCHQYLFRILIQHMSGTLAGGW
jgi:hypothetical protein